VDEIPEDASCLVIYSPASDISEEEKEMLSDYVENVGKLMVMAGPVEDGSLENLYSLLADYGVETVDGIVVEGDRNHYAFQAPYVLMPDVNSDEITDSLIDEHYYPILPISQALIVNGDNENVTALLTTSEDSFSKAAGYSLSTYEKEEDDTDGPFALAVSITCGNDGQIVWFSSSSFLDDTYNSYSSGANVDLGMNAMSSLIGESEAMAIRSKSLNYNYLTISASTSSLLKMLMIGVFPLAYLGIGIAVSLRRRGLQK
jgi:ABC-2 type transport system permease protein